MFRDSTPLRAGQKLGRYELIAPVARGGTGQVWAGRLRGARGFHKLVAIKTLLTAAGDSAHREQRLLEEARIAALIQHSNVEQTLELGEHEGTLYLVMEWVDGEPLSDVIAAAHEAGGIPHLVAVNLVAQTLRGLQAAHELTDEAGQPLGVVHGDVSPSNVLVSYTGIAKLVDFGIAQATDPFRDGELQHDFSYKAPEQVRGGLVDQRADLFAVGVLLYVLTTGRHPFAGANSEDAQRSIVSGEPAVRPSLLKPNYSRTLEAVVLKGLEKDLERRWHSAEEMRLALQRGVPQAFELGFEAQLRNFMGDTVGDRALRKRDLLHRAELAVDARLGRSPSGGPASSIASLRAISVDADGRKVDSAPPQANHPPARRPSQHSLRSLQSIGWRRRWLRPLALGIAAAAGAVVFGLVWQRPSHGPSPAASSPGAGMVDLSPPRAASVAVRPVASLVPSALASTRRPGGAAHQER